MGKGRFVKDERKLYTEMGKEFEDHQTMKHVAHEYINAMGFTTNNVENFFGVFKRGMRGTYTFCGEQRLQRYLTEFQFPYNNLSALTVSDADRTPPLLT